MMKKILLCLIILIVSCKKTNTKTITSKIKSITYDKIDINGENHFGFSYDFNITIDSSQSIKILNFCKDNFSTILNKRVTDSLVVSTILKELNIDNNENVNIDSNPIGLRITTSTENYDAVELEIYLKEDKLLHMELKYYSPL